MTQAKPDEPPQVSIFSEEEIKAKRLFQETMAQQLEKFFRFKAEQSYLEAMHNNQLTLEKALDEVSSDHDSHGKLKPSHQPFNRKGVTFTSAGKLLQLKLPILKDRVAFRMEDAIKVIDDNPPKGLANLVKGVKGKGEP